MHLSAAQHEEAVGAAPAVHMHGLVGRLLVSNRQRRQVPQLFHRVQEGLTAAVEFGFAARLAPLGAEPAKDVTGGVAQRKQAAAAAVSLLVEGVERDTVDSCGIEDSPVGIAEAAGQRRRELSKHER